MISIWEQESYYAPQDVIIAGAGFAGLWSAYHLKKNNPSLKILILEKNVFPMGASTRNAGFACFGSVTELIDDARIFGEEKMLAQVELRYEGVRKINKVFSGREIKYKQYGGYELITKKQYEFEEELQHDINWLNELLHKKLGEERVFKLSNKKLSRFGFQGTDYLVENKLEAQLHPGLLMQSLTAKLQLMGVRIMTGTALQSFERINDQFLLQTNAPVTLAASRLLLCTNGLSGHLLPGSDIAPARGQVLVTSPIEGLPFKGSFHYDEGFYYFRNLGNRVLLGGARNAAFAEEQTTSPGLSATVQNELERFLREIILPGKDFTITNRWSGIMGIGKEKSPAIKQLQPGCFCVVGLGGIGVALAPMAGKMVAEMMFEPPAGTEIE